MTASKVPPAPPPTYIWERMPGESAAAYAHFREYCAQAEHKSIRKVAEKFGLNDIAMRRQAKRWSWVERDRAETNFKIKQTQEDERQAVRSMLKRHAAASAKLNSIAIKAMKDFDPADLDGREIGYLLDISHKNERLARGLPTQNIEQNTLLEVKDDSTIRAIISNPEAHRAAIKLAQALGLGKGDTCAPGMDGDEGKVRESPAPGTTEP